MSLISKKENLKAGMQILMGTACTVITIDNSKFNSSHFLSFITTQFASHNVSNDSIMLHYTFENHHKHLFLLKWITALYAKAHQYKMPNIKEVLINRIEKPIKIIAKNTMKPLNTVCISKLKNHCIRFTCKQKNRQLLLAFHVFFKKAIQKISYWDYYFDVDIQDEEIKKRVWDLIHATSFQQMELLFQYDAKVKALLQKKKQADQKYIRALQHLNSRADEDFLIIKKRYKQLLVRYHPDNVYQEGTKKVDEYTQIFKTLQHSFDVVKEANATTY